MQKIATPPLNCQTKNYSHSFYSEIEAISEEIWNDLDCEKNSYFHRDFLKSMEQNHPEIQFCYHIISDIHHKSCAFFTFQIIDFKINSISCIIIFLFKFCFGTKNNSKSGDKNIFTL